MRREWRGNDNSAFVARYNEHYIRRMAYICPARSFEERTTMTKWDSRAKPNEFIRVQNGDLVYSLRVADIVAIQSPHLPNKPTWWAENVAAAVFMRGLPDPVCLDSDQFAQLKDKLGSEQQ